MRFNLFKSITTKGVLGIDIGTSSIKAVELEKRGGRFYLINYAIFELRGSKSISPSDGWQSILKMPDEEIAEGIKELIKKADITSSDVVSSIPSFSTFSTVIEMPYISNEDLARSLQFEAKNISLFRWMRLI